MVVAAKNSWPYGRVASVESGHLERVQGTETVAYGWNQIHDLMVGTV